MTTTSGGALRARPASFLAALAVAALAACSSAKEDPAGRCSDECPSAGSGLCTSGELQLCGDADGDGCLEWGAPASCGVTRACAAGACEQLPPPGVMVIDEVLFDAPGPDTSAFVELRGEPGLDLAGFALVGVNGADGLDYHRIDLVGFVDPAGFFVVALPGSDASILATAGQVDAGADYQNGPDSLQLRWGAAVVDAVAWGTFGATDVAAGEGTPVVTGAGLVGRDASGTDTDQNAADFAALTLATPGAPNLRTLPPVARLACPAGGAMGVPLPFDGSGSDDADGSIVHYAFDFGDGSSVGGPSATAAHAYAAGGARTVALTVTDDLGATGSATCGVTIAGPDAPWVAIVSPAVGGEVTQGDAILVEVSATPGSGRAIVSVELLVDGQPAGVDVAAPYAIAWAVPAGAVTGSTLQLQARATDGQGDVGFSAPMTLTVRNDPPRAAFTARVTGATAVSVDATASRDREADAALELCWDWDADGTCDTTWSTARTASHDYGAGGTRTIVLRVRDALGQGASTTRTVDLSRFDVAGEVTTTTWYGTVTVTGDVHVGAGQTLTISPGTTIQVVELDQDADGVGDLDILVDGTLLVEGTPGAPVVFTSLPASGPGAARDWGGLRLGAGAAASAIAYAVVEDADVALTAQAPVTLADVELRASRIGLQLQGYAGAATLASVTLRENTGDGLVASAPFTATGLVSSGNGARGISATAGAVGGVVGCTVTGNATHGVEVVGATVDLDGCTVDGNGKVGVLYRGNAVGLLKHSAITRNGEEGIRALSLAGASPAPVIEWNDLWGNATLGSLVYEPLALSVTSPASGVGTVVSGTFTAPAGATLLAARAAHTEYEVFPGDVTGYLDAWNGATFQAVQPFPNPATARWYDLSAAGASGLRTRVVDLYFSSDGTTSASGVAYLDPAARRQLSVLMDGGTVIARHNYLGAWPDVGSVLTWADASQLDVQGFVGAPFGGVWDAGPYRGGESLTSAVTWSSDVWITGNVTVAGGGSLTVAPGVKVTFVPTDLDADGAGDWRITRGEGALSLLGTTGSPVVVTALAPVPAGGGFQGILGSGSGTTTIENATIALGRDGVVASGGVHALTGVAITGAARHGLSVTAGGVSWDGGTISGAGLDGIHLVSTVGSTLDHLTVTGNAGWGVHLEAVGGASPAVLRNSVLSDNGVGGVRLLNAAADVQSSTISGNGLGLRIEGSAVANVSLNDVTGNRREGILAIFQGTSSPTAVVAGNNLVGNATAQAAIVEPVAVTVTSSPVGTGTVVSGVWSAAAGATVLAVRAAYTEYEFNFADVTGYLETGSGSPLQGFPSTTPSRWLDVSGALATSLRTRVVDLYSSAYGTASASRVVSNGQSTSPVRPVELTAVVQSGVVDARGNYWGTLVDVPSRIVEGDPGCVDYSGFLSTPVVGTGPQ